MIQNLRCINCDSPLDGTNFYCSLRCAGEDMGLNYPSEELYERIEHYGPDEKMQEIENANQDLLSDQYNLS